MYGNLTKELKIHITVGRLKEQNTLLDTDTFECYPHGGFIKSSNHIGKYLNDNIQ